MTDPDRLQAVIVAKLREQSNFLRDNIATWQLLEKAATEIERLQGEVEFLRVEAYGEDRIGVQQDGKTK